MTGLTTSVPQDGVRQFYELSSLKYVDPVVVIDPATGAAAVSAPGPATAVYRLLSSLATTNLALLRTGVGVVKYVKLFNAAVTDKYLKLYDKAIAPVIATDTPYETFHIPARSDYFMDFGDGLKFALGIGLGITGAAADADTTVLAVGDITCLSIGYV